MDGAPKSFRSSGNSDRQGHGRCCYLGPARRTTDSLQIDREPQDRARDRSDGAHDDIAACRRSHRVARYFRSHISELQTSPTDVRSSIGTAVANAARYDYASFPVRPNGPCLQIHAKIPSHRNPSVECLRIHVKGVVCSTGRLGGVPEVGRGGGPGRRRQAKGLLDASPREKTVRCGTAQRAQDYAKAAIAKRRNHRYQPLTGPIANQRRSARRDPEPKQALATILFVDIVGSTAKAARLGDARWTTVMGLYYAAVRKELKALRGKEVVTTGDGLLATFRAPDAGVRCAGKIHEAVRTWGCRSGWGCMRANSRSAAAR